MGRSACSNPIAHAGAVHRQSYVAIYLERDLRQSLQVASLRDFERFIRACALRTGQMLNRADLARDVGISGSTTAAWLSVLAASGQVRVPLGGPFTGGPAGFSAGRRSVRDAGVRRAAPAPDRSPRRLGAAFLAGSRERGRFELAEAKWTELPTDRDSAGLRRLIDELGEKAVGRAAIICRCRNQFPLPGSIPAIPLGELPPTWA